MSLVESDINKPGDFLSPATGTKGFFIVLHFWGLRMYGGVKPSEQMANMVTGKYSSNHVESYKTFALGVIRKSSQDGLG